MRKVTKWMAVPLAGIGDSGLGSKGSAKDGPDSDITVGFAVIVKATQLELLDFRGVPLMNVGGSLKREMVVQSVS